MLDLAAIRVKDAIAEINIWTFGLLNKQYLIAPHAKMAIAKKAGLLRCQRHRLANAIQNNEIIAQTVHFREFQFHWRLYASSVPL